MMKSMTRSVLMRSTIVAAAFVATAATAQEQSGELTVYTALLPSVLEPYAAAFNEKYPDIKINWVREAGGMLTARLIAEKDNPRADVIWGLPIPEIVTLNAQGLIEPYSPAGVDAVKPMFVDPVNNPPAWVGMDMFLNVICFNTVEAEKLGLPKPTTWSDLTDPAFAGQVTMPNPMMSSTGYGYVQGWMQTIGEEQTWPYLDALHANVAMYTNSSSTPCKQAAAGEYAVGLSTDFNASSLVEMGAPLELIVPDEGTGWGIEAVALPKGSHQPELAKLLLDFAVSPEANEAYAQFYGTVGLSGIESAMPHAIPGGEEKAVKLDIVWANENRDRILAEWAKRYSTKAEPKAN